LLDSARLNVPDKKERKMKVKNLGFAVCAFALAMFFGKAAFAEEGAVQDFLQIKAGTMQLGGVVSLSVDTMFPNVGSSKTGAMLDIAPSFGYFIIDSLELSAGVDFTAGLGDLYDGTDKAFGFNLGARYVVDILLAVYPYFGAQFGMNFPFTDKKDDPGTVGIDESAAPPNQLRIAVPAGLLVALNPHVAIDLGFRLVFIAELDDNGSNYLNIPIGYLGVEGFF
jgi:hypothetical protein